MAKQNMCVSQRTAIATTKTQETEKPARSFQSTVKENAYDKKHQTGFGDVDAEVPSTFPFDKDDLPSQHKTARLPSFALHEFWHTLFSFQRT